MKKPKSFEAMYPTKAAREKADAMFDKLPLETTIAEAIRRWEWTYLDAGGIVKP
jgi:hypothetical protein